jgi:hypothetical protein
VLVVLTTDENERITIVGGVTVEGDPVIAELGLQRLSSGISSTEAGAFLLELKVGVGDLLVDQRFNHSIGLVGRDGAILAALEEKEWDVDTVGGGSRRARLVNRRGRGERPN